MTTEEKQKVKKLERIWKIDSHSDYFAVSGNINDLTGFISPDGVAIPIPEKEHSSYMRQYEEEIGLDDDTYYKEYGAIRTRPGRVFITGILGIPWDSFNVEIFKKPTMAQINTLNKITSNVFYDFWGEDDTLNCSKNTSVSPKTFMKKLRKFWKI